MTNIKTTKHSNVTIKKDSPERLRNRLKEFAIQHFVLAYTLIVLLVMCLAFASLMMPFSIQTVEEHCKAQQHYSYTTCKLILSQ